VVGADVLARPPDDLVIRLAPDHGTAFTADLLGHGSSFLSPVSRIVVRARRWVYVGAALERVKAQLCGRFVLERAGCRFEQDLPGRQGRLLAAYLIANRDRTVVRDDLLEALWPDGRDGGLAPLLSKVRRVLPLDGLRPTDELWVDVEAATAAVHHAESALALHDPHAAWGTSQVAMFVCERTFLAGEDGPWIEEERRRLAGLRVRAIEAYAGAALGVGGTELAAATRAGRRLVELEPYRESGYRILMEALDREGNAAEAVLVYDRLRTLLREELGVTPSPATQQLHRRLLR